MKYPLEKLDYLIYKHLHPAVLIKTINEGNYTLKIWHEVMEVDSEIKFCLLEQVNLVKKKKHVKRCVNIAHAGCINHFHAISKYIVHFQSLTDIKGSHLDVIKQYMQLQNKLGLLVSFIEETFGIYSDFKNSPCFTQHEVLNAYRQRYAKLKLNLVKQNIDPALLKIILEPLADFFDTGTSHNAKYAQFLYLKEYISHMEKSPLQNGREHIDTRLRNTLFFLNYNSPLFVELLLAKMREDIKSSDLIAQKISAWQLFYKEIRLLDVHPGLTFCDNAPSVKKQVLKKIKAEIKYLQMLQQQDGTIGSHLASSAAVEERLLTSLSVPQIALFTRLLVDVGILPANNRSSILRKIATCLSTAKAGSISEESLRIKYYTPQSPAINIIKEYLHKMIDLLRNY